MQIGILRNGRAVFRLGAEMGPLLLFFVVTRWQGILWGTAVFVAATAVATIVSYWYERRVPILPIFGTAFALLFGALTLAYADPFWIKIRPTVFNLLAALVLAAALWRGRLVLRSIFGVSIAMHDAAWRSLTVRLIVFLVALAVLNEVVWRSASTDTWVAFKAFAMPPLNLLFLAVNWPFLRRNQQTSGCEGPLACHLVEPV